MSKTKRKRYNVFLEDDLITESREASKDYPKLPERSKASGSASWYVREATMEKLGRDGVEIKALDLNDHRIAKRK